MKAALKIPDQLDYHALGLRVGLEIHQQLNTPRKLFCSCPPKIVDENELKNSQRFVRMLRIGRSELGELDAAAAFEFQRGRVFEYLAPSSASCLVELDEEPPHPICEEAVVSALAIALALNAEPVDEVHVMRKIVVDGSNTTGFQRTAIVALGGIVRDPEGDVRIQTITVEEDAARKVSEHEGRVVYSLDRLGIPLIEISTAPDIRSPEHAKRVAEKIGLLMRLAGIAKRGIGTIRQDINLSIAGSPKIEIKGVQRLDLLPKVIANEARRLYGLLMIRDELRRRGVKEEELRVQVPIDITDVFKETQCKFIKRAVKRGERVYALKLPKFEGILGVELQPNRRFGTELADYVRQWTGLAGLIHSDELPAYGISNKEIEEIRKRLGIHQRDAFVLVVGPAEKALRALEVVKTRCIEALYGIPKETRAANEDGTTRYMRPQPGAARMYPETDIPPLRITEELIDKARKLAPPTPDEKISELMKRYGLSEDLARQIIHSEYLRLFEDAAKRLKNLEPSLIASLFTTIRGELRKDGIDIDSLSDDKILTVIEIADAYKLDKDSIKNLLEYVYKNPAASIDDIKHYVEKELKALNIDEIRRIIREKIEQYRSEVLKRGPRAFSFLMGKIMQELRGRVSGKVVAEILREELSKSLEGS